jgi:hypothetical protein
LHLVKRFPQNKHITLSTNNRTKYTKNIFKLMISKLYICFSPGKKALVKGPLHAYTAFFSRISTVFLLPFLSPPIIPYQEGFKYIFYTFMDFYYHTLFRIHNYKS